MYRYDEFDHQLVQSRVSQFREQVRRFDAGEIVEDDFKPLRLMNGLYVQTHAPMLRVAVPYGLLNSKQMRMLAHIARTYDKGYGHFSTRQNIQYNWPELNRVPDILAELATVEMHAIQTSGNCIRNITTDHLAGVAKDEIVDPRPYCEITRQWSTFHPEFTFLPRKFKIAFSASHEERAAIAIHDIGVYVVKNDAGEIGYRIMVGGGLGRTPILGVVIREWLPELDLLSYLESVVRVYNRFGIRENMNKARIKILVKTLGKDKFAELVEQDWAKTQNDPRLKLTPQDIAHFKAFFTPKNYLHNIASIHEVMKLADENPAFASWVKHNTTDNHRAAGYRAVYIPLKIQGVPPGDATDTQMDVVAELAEKYAFGEIRVTHSQNLVLADVHESNLFALWQALRPYQLAMPNFGTAQDMICCPGLDFCALANASSISVANELQDLLENMDYVYDLGELQIKMSGCMNGCGHHSVGHLGILGVDKDGAEWYQLTLGGSAGNEARLGDRLGAAIAKDQVVPAIGKILNTYLAQRTGTEESFLATIQRVGVKPFALSVYGK